MPLLFNPEGEFSGMLFGCERKRGVLGAALTNAVGESFRGRFRPSSAAPRPRSRPGRCSRAGVNGGSASKISLIVPMQASSEVRARSPSRKRARLGAVAPGCTLQPGVDERADQPGPDRALVIGRVARAQVAVVRAPCSRGGPGASERRPTGVSSRCSHDLEHRRPARRVEHRVRAARWRRSGSAGSAGSSPFSPSTTSYR